MTYRKAGSGWDKLVLMKPDFHANQPVMRLRRRYLQKRPAMLKINRSLKLYFRKPAARAMSGDDRGKKLNARIVKLPYLVIYFSAFRNRLSLTRRMMPLP